MKRLIITTAIFALCTVGCADETSLNGTNDETIKTATKQDNHKDAKSLDDIDKSAHDYSFVGIAGEPMPLSQFEGRPVLVVNTASLCGFTKQYSGLQALYERYEDDGFVVLGVPSNDFGGQEPGSNQEIKGFCEANFNIRFPLTEKTKVSGEDAHPFYTWAQKKLGAENAPKWNFHKYLVGADGKLVTAFASSVNPQSEDLKNAVEAAIQSAKKL
ncbi:MAG: glutathione peroxidase [Pseudomonadota bacterium]